MKNAPEFIDDLVYAFIVFSFGLERSREIPLEFAMCEEFLMKRLKFYLIFYFILCSIFVFFYCLFYIIIESSHVWVQQIFHRYNLFMNQLSFALA